MAPESLPPTMGPRPDLAVGTLHDLGLSCEDIARYFRLGSPVVRRTLAAKGGATEPVMQVQSRRPMFRDRAEAGRLLAAEIVALAPRDPVVLALPRGGVPVGFEIARALECGLDVLIVRKLGAPDNPELAAGAIVDCDPVQTVFNDDIVERYGLDEDQRASMVAREMPELRRCSAAYRGERSALRVAGRTVILVDDGAATGATMKVALRALRQMAPLSVVVALPVAPQETVAALEAECDAVVCLARPGRFRALGYHYRDFAQLADADVLALLARARAKGAGAAPPA
jgi:putative phosphoribosyl transferase